MKDNKKLAKVIAYLLETHEDSRGYMDSFYEDCQNGEIEDLDWLASDDEMSDAETLSDGAEMNESAEPTRDLGSLPFPAVAS